MQPALLHLSLRYSGGSARPIEFGIPQIYSRTSDRFRRRAADGPLSNPIETLVVETAGFGLLGILFSCGARFLNNSKNARSGSGWTSDRTI